MDGRRRQEGELKGESPAQRGEAVSPSRQTMLQSEPQPRHQRATIPPSTTPFQLHVGRYVPLLLLSPRLLTKDPPARSIRAWKLRLPGHVRRSSGPAQHPQRWSVPDAEGKCDRLAKSVQLGAPMLPST